MSVAAASAHGYWGNEYGFSISDVEQFTEGLLLGALEAEIPDVMTCITDAESVVTEVETAYTDFAKETFDGVRDGIVEIGTMVQTLASTIQACSGAVTQIQSLISMAKNFADPASFAWHAGKDLLIHGVDIYNEINSAITDYESSNYKGFGENVGKALAQVLVGAEYGYHAELKAHVSDMFLN